MPVYMGGSHITADMSPAANERRAEEGGVVGRLCEKESERERERAREREKEKSYLSLSLRKLSSILSLESILRVLRLVGVRGGQYTARCSFKVGVGILMEYFP